MVQLKFNNKKPVKILENAPCRMWREGENSVVVDNGKNRCVVNNSTFVSGLDKHNKPPYNFWKENNIVKINVKNSTNPVLIDGAKIGKNTMKPIEIKTDSTVRIGDFSFQIKFNKLKKQEKRTQNELKSLGENMNRSNSRGLSK